MVVTLLLVAMVLSQNREEHLSEARAFLEQERLEEALTAIDAALARSPGDFEGLYLRGICLMRLGKFAEAALELAAALEKNPDDAACREELGRAHFRSNEPDKTVAVLEPLVETGGASSTASALALYGNALAQIGRSEDAIPHLEKAVALEPQRVQAVFFLARALLDVGRYEESAGRFRSGVDLPAPHNIRFEVGLAEAELRLIRRPEARERLASLLERYPRVARAWYLMGVLEASDERYPEAADAFSKAIDLGFVSAQVYVDYGVALMTAGDRVTAHEAIDQAITRDARLAAAHYYKALMVLEDGVAVREEGRNRPNPFRDEAIQHLDRASALAEQPSMQLSLAEVYIKVRRYEQAVEVASRVANSPALAAEAQFVIARAYHELLDTTSAEEAYREAIARGLKGSEVYLNLGRMYMAIGRFDDANEVLVEALDRDPASAVIHMQLGMNAIKQREYDLAYAHLLKAAELKPEDPETWYQKGIAEAERRDSEAAVSSWRRAIELDLERTQVYYRLGNELVKLGRVDEGRGLLEKFQSLSVEDRRQRKLNSQLWPLLRSGVEAVEEGRYDDALVIFEDTVKLAPGEAPPYLYLAEFHLGRGEPMEAESVLSQGLELLPDNVHLHKLLIKVFEDVGDEAGAERQRRRLEELVSKR